MEKHFGLDLYRFGKDAINKVVDNRRFDYDTVWQSIIKTKPASNKNLPGAFVGFNSMMRVLLLVYYIIELGVQESDMTRIYVIIIALLISYNRINKDRYYREGE